MKTAKAMIVLALLTLLPIASFAATKKHLTVTEPVAVGNTVLKPGDYQVAWTGNGPQVQVEFISAGKTVATAPAAIKQVHSPYDGAMDLKEASGDKAKELRAINFSKVSLDFSGGGSAPAGQ